MRAVGSLASSCAALLLVATACTHTYEAPEEPLAIPSSGTVQPLAVRLQLSPELRAAKWERRFMGDKWVMPLGDALAANSEAVARAAFADVESGEGAATDRPTLTTTLVALDRTMGATAFGESILDLVLEWRLTAADGSLVWVETVRGRGTRHTGNLVTQHGNAREQIGEALTQLFTRSYEVLVGSPEIRAWATRRSDPAALAAEPATSP